jgi:hypothetical protein
MIGKKFIRLAIITVFTIGCSKDLLNVDPKSQVLESNFYQTKEDLDAALISAYDPISWVFHWGASTFVTLNVASDDANAGGTPGGQDIMAYQGADKFNLTPGMERIESLWRKYYAGIYRANLVIENADTANPDLSVIIAEAKFLRAYYYFDLVRYYGDVVLLDHTATVDEYSLPRTAAEEVYALIVRDLSEAIPVLPDKDELTHSQLFRATKSAAQALLGKVYLFMSSPANNYGNYYQEAANLFGRIIRSGIYDLHSDYDRNFLATYEHGIESIFELEYTSAINSTFQADDNTGYSYDEASVDFKLCGIREWNQGSNTSVVNMLAGWGFIKPTRELVQAYIDENDRIRLNYNVYLGNPMSAEIDSAFDFYLSQYGTWGSEEEDSEDFEGFFRRKYRYDADYVVGDISFLNINIIRYADVLLMMAECMVNGATDTENGQNAVFYLNKVRNRVNLPSLSSVTLGDIKKERRLEFAFEMIRYWDLVRWGDADGVFTNYKPGKGYQWDPVKKGLWPIPLTEINRSGGSLIQNPGYTNE